MEKKTVTYLKISEGKVYATGMEKPEGPPELSNFSSHENVMRFREQNKAMEKFSQSFVEVSNARLNKEGDLFCFYKPDHSFLYSWKNIDGLYTVEGMVMDIGERFTTKGSWKVCTISLEPVEKRQTKNADEMLRGLTYPNHEKYEPKEIETTPDFEAMAIDILSLRYKAGYVRERMATGSYPHEWDTTIENQIIMASRIWKEHQEDREWFKIVDMANKDFHKQIQEAKAELNTLREENKSLKERLDFQIEANDLLYSQIREKE